MVVKLKCWPCNESVYNTQWLACYLLLEDAGSFQNKVALLFFRFRWRFLPTATAFSLRKDMVFIALSPLTARIYCRPFQGFDSDYFVCRLYKSAYKERVFILRNFSWFLLNLVLGKNTNLCDEFKFWKVGRPGFDSGYGGIVVSSHCPDRPLIPPQSPVRWMPRALSTRAKRPDREADTSPVSSVRVYHECGFACTFWMHLDVVMRHRGDCRSVIIPSCTWGLNWSISDV